MTHQNLSLVKCWKLYRATLSSGRQVNGYSKLFNLSPVLIEGTAMGSKQTFFANFFHFPFLLIFSFLRYLPKDSVCFSDARQS